MDSRDTQMIIDACCVSFTALIVVGVGIYIIGIMKGSKYTYRRLMKKNNPKSKV